MLLLLSHIIISQFCLFSFVYCLCFVLCCSSAILPEERELLATGQYEALKEKQRLQANEIDDEVGQSPLLSHNEAAVLV